MNPKLVFFALLSGAVSVLADTLLEEYEDSTGYTIEGKVFPPDVTSMSNQWPKNSVVTINGGEFKGFLKEDGSFIISSVPSGSYVLEVLNPDYIYEPVRVEINPKGKFRARKVNYIIPSQILQVPYPLKLKALSKFRYFQQREQWKITDFLFNPMIIIMVLPLLLMLVLPKMMNDPETKKEMEQLNLNKMTSDMPEISEMITSFFNPASSTAKASDKSKASTSGKTNKKRN
ncbi:ER membrane protein complex subunit 7 homolog [Culicoides brevitarsis]|uniref:ER membrane protein complex subunit 7 homolog n=1 Tax=Culicoides brevitarsis TaxID=469753 RepID=UPI00307C5F76